MNRCINKYVIPSLIIYLTIYCSLNAADRVTGYNFSGRSEIVAKNGMVATSQPLAAQVALDILKQGGNAVDAAIAANAMLGLVEPMGSGMGGDIFIVLWDAKTQKLYGYNGSGRSPRDISYERMKEILSERGLEDIPLRGALSISVPGTVDGWFAVHERFGSMPMEKILKPAISYAREGFPVSELISYHWGNAPAIFGEQPGFLDAFTIDGKTPAKGDIWKNPALANTLEIVGKEGRDAWYKGDIAKQISAFIQKHGGYLSYEDFAAHKGEWVEPVSTNYRGYDVWELPPNGQGIAALQMLNILELFDIKKMGFASADYAHLFFETKKLAFEDRAKFYSDPAFNKIPIEQLISKEYAINRSKLIDMKQAAKKYAAGSSLTDHGDTIYLTVADSDNNIVSLIQSNYWGFGSGLCPPGLGFALQDRGYLFAMKEGHFNQYEAGKRPFHTIIPAFVTKGNKPWLSFGVMGGSTQPQGHVQILVNLIDFGMNLQEAGDAPRMHHGGSSQPTGEHMTDGGVVGLEEGYDYEVIRELIRRGHKVQWKIGAYGGFQGIMYDSDKGVYYGASESRKDGQAVGY